MNKKNIIIVVASIAIILIIFGTMKKLNKEKADNEFAVYSIKDINISNSNANLIFLDDMDGKGQEELIVNKGFKYTFNKAGEHTIEVLELTDEYITLSINGLAPRKKTGGFSLMERYDKITIKKNTGICLNVQATDVADGSIYFFYVNQ